MADKVKKRVRDWSALDAAHRKRGELITVFFDSEAGAFAPPARTARRGAPLTYAPGSSRHC